MVKHLRNKEDFYFSNDGTDEPTYNNICFFPKKCFTRPGKAERHAKKHCITGIEEGDFKIVSGEGENTVESLWQAYKCIGEDNPDELFIKECTPTKKYRYWCKYPKKYYDRDGNIKNLDCDDEKEKLKKKIKSNPQYGKNINTIEDYNSLKGKEKKQYRKLKKLLNKRR